MLRAVINYVNSPEATAKALGQAVAVANAETVNYWHEGFLPLHFSVEGGKKYGYQARKGDNEPPTVPGKRGGQIANRHYSWVKRRKFHHNKPLVYSGQSEIAAKRQIRITSSRKRATGTMSLPKYFYQYRKDLAQPDKSAELTAVAPDELPRMAAHHEKVAGRELNSIRVTQTVRVP